MDPLFLSLDEVLEIHGQQIERYGGSSGIGEATFDGEFLHRSIPAMAAAYLYHLCQNHAFIDGNKRVGANAAITFLLINDWDLAFDESALVELVFGVASGLVGKPELIRIFESCCHPIGVSPSLEPE